MHFILATVGTDGDVFPHIGLAIALHRRGHRVTLAAPEIYRERARGLGIEFCAIVESAEMEKVLADPDMWHPLRGGMMMARWGGRLIARQYEALAALAALAALDGPRHTVIVANPGVLAARMVQEKLGVR